MKPYSRCRGWIHFVNVSQNNYYQIARHHNIKGLLYKHVMDADQKLKLGNIPY